MVYKGFTTSNIIEQEGKYSATVENSSEYIKIEADAIEDMQSKFETAIEKHIKKCEELGINP